MKNPGFLRLWVLLLLLPAASHATPTPSYFTAFFSGLLTLQADFDQQVLDGNRQLLQSSQGHMWIKRPGRFRWDYETPYRQQLVADGERLWSYDEDLEQVTVQPAAEVLTATPAVLLSGDKPLESLFRIEEASAKAGEQQVMLIPKSDDSNITRLLLHFSGNMLTRIDAEDSFGNTTLFSFTHLERNPELDEKIFTFTPPAGADVVGNTR
ncbi:MAG: outer membrane lipoprotein chaperone LolA [Gammaproteobacteria bacterium]|jgi:chaperone LolA|nr:outer membrane lipoprotein chaperone LolA [Gammaproteobacteria bacterium]